jgi:hypothetical protein
MIVVDFVMSVVAFRCRTMMRLSLWHVVLRGRKTLRGLMTRRRMRGATFSSARGCHHWSAESYTGKSENHKLFERLVHITPSLSSFVLMRAFLAAYIKIGVVSVIF